MNRDQFCQIVAKAHAESDKTAAEKASPYANAVAIADKLQHVMQRVKRMSRQLARDDTARKKELLMLRTISARVTSIVGKLVADEITEDDTTESSEMDLG